MEGYSALGSHIKVTIRTPREAIHLLIRDNGPINTQSSTLPACYTSTLPVFHPVSLPHFHSSGERLDGEGGWVGGGWRNTGSERVSGFVPISHERKSDTTTAPTAFEQFRTGRFPC